MLSPWGSGFHIGILGQRLKRSTLTCFRLVPVEVEYAQCVCVFMQLVNVQTCSLLSFSGDERSREARFHASFFLFSFKYIFKLLFYFTLKWAREREIDRSHLMVYSPDGHNCSG